ncbi:MAG: tRNA lysidine(34) synthetase TilS [Treponema sp.]|nr:tRNA lysidine(34) synthetase TilS [Treponema sp.]
MALAHNQNDQLETVLMRFLQGSGTEGLAGISCVRGKYIRPLLDISRDEIESYLIKKNQEWRTDETNFETKYLRNKVRNLLIPFLRENFPGFGKALLNGAKKARWDEEFFQLKAKDCHTDIRRRCTQIDADKKEISFKREEFYSLHKALSRRVFVSALNEAGFGERFPFYLLDEILLWKNEKKRELSFENVKVSLDEGTLCLFVGEKGIGRSCTQIDEDDEGIESGFSFVLKKTGDKAVTADFEAEVSSGEFGQVDEGFGELLAGGRKILDVKLPVLVRSLLSGDEIKTSDGKYKALSDVFTDWKVPKNLRGKIPVVEEIGEKGEIVAVLGENCGFKNWIVKK